jgi:hypothetical protein
LTYDPLVSDQTIGKPGLGTRVGHDMYSLVPPRTCTQWNPLHDTGISTYRHGHRDLTKQSEGVSGSATHTSNSLVRKHTKLEEDRTRHVELVERRRKIS